MDADSLIHAARLIAEARIARRRFAGLPAELRPPGEDAAYDVQDALCNLLVDAGFGRPAGFKIGCTTQVMQRYLDIDHPCAGYVFTGRIVEGDAVFAADAFVRPGVECEIVVELARPLSAAAAPFDRSAVAKAVGAARAAIEVVDDRYVDWRAMDAPTLVADDFFHAALVLGPRVPDWRALDLAGLAGTIRIDGKLKGEGRGADVLDDPLNALVWLANHRAARGESLVAGTLVSLGSLTETQWLNPGQRAEIEIDGLGSVRLRCG